MLHTPLGSLKVQMDHVTIDYTYILVPLERLCPDLSGRYAIEIPFCPDGSPHIISCRIKKLPPSPDDEINSGERLELYSFFQNGTKLSLGTDENKIQTCFGADLVDIKHALS